MKKRSYQDRKAQEQEVLSESDEEIDEHLYFSKEEVEKQGRKYVNMPKKGHHRMHAHINPFNPLHIAHPRNTTYVDWSEHYPKYYGKANDTIVINTKKYPTKNDYKDQVE